MLNTLASVSQKTRWNKHLDMITAKASSKLGFVKRNVNTNNLEVKAQAYKFLDRPILEYIPTVWDPYTVSETKQLESVQRQAARITVGQPPVLVPCCKSPLPRVIVLLN